VMGERVDGRRSKLLFFVFLKKEVMYEGVDG
jgi:hypothetical protein